MKPCSLECKKWKLLLFLLFGVHQSIGPKIEHKFLQITAIFHELQHKNSEINPQYRITFKINSSDCRNFKVRIYCHILPMAYQALHVPSLLASGTFSMTLPLERQHYLLEIFQTGKQDMYIQQEPYSQEADVHTCLHISNGKHLQWK